MTPRYEWVAAKLRARLAKPEWEIGERIPGISELMREYDIRSLNTIRQAQAILVAEGLLRTEQGRGVFVKAHPTRLPAPDDRNTAALKAIDQAIQLLQDARRALTSPDAGHGQ
jgi:DNA-binding GntR family transcriptional regulator